MSYSQLTAWVLITATSCGWSFMELYRSGWVILVSSSCHDASLPYRTRFAWEPTRAPNLQYLNWIELILSQKKGLHKRNPMNMLPLYEPKKSKDIHNYKVQTLQKIKIWSASNWNWSWLYTKVTSRLFPLPSPPLQDLAFALPLVAIFVVVVIIFIVSACVVYRARYGYFCCWKPVSLSSQFASQERNTYVPHAMSHALQ